MDFITQLGLVWPDGNFWASIIKIFDVNSYAWTILIFTIVLKLILSPLDFLQRFYTNKTTRAQARIQPELEKLKKRYGQNQNLLYQKQTELYKKNNFSMKGSCIVMLLYMAVTLTVFLTLFNSLQTISSFKIKDQYNDLQESFHAKYDVLFDDYLSELDADKNAYSTLTTEEDKYDFIISSYMAKNMVSEDVAKEQVNVEINNIVVEAQKDVSIKYEEIKDSWLWVKNIWRGDKATVSAILSYNDYINATGENVSQKEYENVMSGLINNKEINCVNGYYILSIIVVCVSFLSQWIIKKTSQPKNTQAQNTKSTKILMIVLPIAMLMFTLNSSAMFSIYIIANSLISTFLTPIITKISNKIEDKNEEKRIQSNKAEYSR